LNASDDDTEEILDWLDSGQGVAQVVVQGEPVAWRLNALHRRDLAYPAERVAPGIYKWVSVRSRVPPF